MSRTKDVLRDLQNEPHSSHMGDDSSWLSASVITTPFFIIPTPTLQNVLEKIGISRSSTTGQFYLASMPFLAQSESKAVAQTPWAVAHSAQKRCKHLGKLISSRKTAQGDIVNEVRCLALSSTDNDMARLSTFADLLNPLLTESPDFQVDMPADDVLVLFGSPATIFQILLFSQPLTSSLTDLILELVATSSPFAQRLLEQFRQPVGLYAMFTTKEAFEDVASRFLDLFKIVQDPQIQATILAILPDLATSQQASSSFLNEEDRSLLILQLIDLLDTLPVVDLSYKVDEIDPITCLIECLVSFPVQDQLAERLHDSFFVLLDRCYGSACYFNYLSVICRCMLISGPSVSRNSPELFKLVSKLRQYFCFPKPEVVQSMEITSTALINVLQTAFQFDHNVVTEWMHAISSSYITQGSSSVFQEVLLNPDQAAQDMIVLIVAYSTLTSTTIVPVAGTTALGNFSCDVPPQRRAQQLVASTFKRLITTGHFVSTKNWDSVMQDVFTNYGYLILSNETGLFTSFLGLLDQLIVTGSLGGHNSNGLNRKLGFAFLTKAFCSPGTDRLQKQDLLIHLIRHISYDLSNDTISPIRRSKLEAVMRSGLSSLVQLAQLKSHELATFDGLICGIQRKLTHVEVSSVATSKVSEMLDIRLAFLILASVAFNIRDQRKLQEDLLALLRKQLSDQSLFSKCVGLTGAVVVLEILCRRDLISNCRKDESVSHAIPADDESILLASQLVHLNEDRPSTSTTNTSRSSNASALSLRGPGTTMADDPNEVNLMEDDSSVNPNQVTLPPPSRLLLQLIGLVEHAIKPHPQLMSFWLDQLTDCFIRLIQLNKTLDVIKLDQTTTRSEWVASLKQAYRFLTWMKARVTRDFQDHFVFDNSSFENCSAQFGLHDSNLCEISIGLGPVWSRFQQHSLTSQTQPSSSRTASKLEHIPCPSLVAAQLNLLAIVEAGLHDDRLDGIDALLGCPLLLPDNRHCSTQTQSATKLPSHDPRLILFTINWFIEAVNAFGPILISNASSRKDDAPNLSDSDSTLLNANFSFLTRRDSTLIRLGQIASLRQNLYLNLLVGSTTKSGTIFESNEDPIHPSTGDQSRAVLSQLISSSQNSDHGCLPTATFEPSPIFGAHSRLNQLKELKQFCFDCGVHLVLKTEDSVGRKRTQSKSDKSVNQTDLKRQKNSKPTKTKPKFVDVDHNQPLEPDELPTTSGSSESASSSEDELVNSSGLKDKDCVGKSKMAVSGWKKSKKANPVLSSNLMEIGACFRELDLHSLVVGLSEWPWLIKCANASEIFDPTTKPPCSGFDWLTLDWLLEDLNLKLDHLAGMSLPTSWGWTSFRRLDNMSHDLKRTLLTHLVPHLYRALRMSLDYLSEHRNPRISSSIVSSSSSSSDDDDDDDNKTNGHDKNMTNKPSKSSQLSQPPIHRQPNTERVSNTICLCLRSLYILLSDLSNPSKTLDRGDTTIVDLISPIGFLASKCIKALGQVCQNSMIDIRIHEIHTLSNGTLKQDSVEDRLAKELDKQLCVPGYGLDSKRVVDALDRTTLDSMDSLVETNYLENPNYVELTSELKIILEQFLIETAPNSFPHASAALLHCRLISLLSNLYHACQIKLIGSIGSDESSPWKPDLFTFTKQLLDQDWESDVKWRGYSYRESLQGILSVHLRCQSGLDPNDVPSSMMDTLVSFTRGLLVPFVRNYQVQRGLTQSRPSSTSEHWTGYRTLDDQTIDIYCREVMETVLWFTKQLCICEKTISSGMALPHLTESHVIAQWNQCIEVLCLLTGFFHAPSSTNQSSHTRGDKLSQTYLSHILPSMMRTGRLFLESLLKGAMPLLSNLFRYRGVEVTTFLRNTQQLTRFLQRVCTHAKAYQNSLLTNQIPATRRCLETFVYRVKVMLSQNQCAEAFWLGTLKNRDLHGLELPDESIQSQASDQTSNYSQSLPDVSRRLSTATMRSTIRKSSGKPCRSKKPDPKSKAKERLPDSIELDARIEGEDRSSDADSSGTDEQGAGDLNQADVEDQESLADPSEPGEEEEEEEDEEEEEELVGDEDIETEDDLIEASDAEL